jgi:tetratricopeptide (TPR) repeat protein
MVGCRALAALFHPESEQQNPIRQAIDCARHSIVLGPSEARGHCALSAVLRRMGQFDEALAEADLGARLDPNSAWAYYHQGFCARLGRAAARVDRSARRCDAVHIRLLKTAR